MVDAALRAGSQTAGSPPLAEDWEDGGGGESSASATVEVVPAAKKRKVSVKKIAKPKVESKIVSTDLSPPPGMSLPELAAVASALAATNPLASSSTLPPSPPPSSTHRHVHHHTSTQSSSTTSKPLSSLSLDDLLQFRNGFRTELEGMKQSIHRMEEWIGKGVELLGVLDGAVDTISNGHHHHHHHHHHNDSSIGKRKERAEGGITSVPLVEVKSRTEEDLAEYLNGLPPFEVVGVPLRTTNDSEKPPVVALVPADVDMVDAGAENM